jgi:hypothetical protein
LSRFFCEGEWVFFSVALIYYDFKRGSFFFHTARPNHFIQRGLDVFFWPRSDLSAWDVHWILINRGQWSGVSSRLNNDWTGMNLFIWTSLPEEERRILSSPVWRQISVSSFYFRIRFINTEFGVGVLSRTSINIHLH